MSCGSINIYNYSVSGDCTDSGLGGVSFSITGGSPNYTVSEISSSGLLPLSSNTTTYLLGVNSHAVTTLRESGALGNIIMNIGAGNFNFPATIALDGSKNIYSTAADSVSLFYYIENN